MIFFLQQSFKNNWSLENWQHFNSTVVSRFFFYSVFVIFYYTPTSYFQTNELIAPTLTSLKGSGFPRVFMDFCLLYITLYMNTYFYPDLFILFLHFSLILFPLHLFIDLFLFSNFQLILLTITEKLFLFYTIKI